MVVIAKRELSCFIIMPFSFRFGSVTRYDKSRGNFVKGIVANLLNADLVIADLTGLNPNVFYELGIRHTLKNGTILLTQDISTLPNDLKNYIAFEYNYPDISYLDNYYPDFERNLHKSIDEYLHEMNQPDNPVMDFLGTTKIIKNEQRKSDLLMNIRLIKLIQQKYISTITELKELCNAWMNGEEKPFLQIYLGVEPILNRMINLNESTQLILFLQNLIAHQEVNNHNIKNIRPKLVKDKNLESIRNTPLRFVDLSNKDYHILDLFKYYDNGINSRIVPSDPMLASMVKLIATWEDELKSIES
jgi:hypothetical protein